MRTKHGEASTLQVAISRMRGVALLGCFIFLLGYPLRGADQLLKEYIYLDGKLLAIERQTVTAVAQQPVIDEDQNLRIDFAVNCLLTPVAASEIDIAPLWASSADGVAAGICCGDWKAEAFMVRQLPQQGGHSDD
jgi:hypothetical protein